MPYDPQGEMVIAFVSRHDDAGWIAALSAAMPTERIVGDRALIDGEAAAVEIVIVADPDPAQLARYRNLKWVQSVWAGVERLLPITAKRNLPLVRLIDPMLAQTMGEAVLAWTLYLHRDMPAYAAQQKQQQWKPRPYRAARDVTVGILGLGELGRAAASRLLDAGYRVCGWSQHGRPIDGVQSYLGHDGLQQVLQQANILVLLLPLTATTRNLINHQRIGMMSRGTALINFARGAIVNSDALVAALDAGMLSHAVLDVFEAEPLPEENTLWAHPKITVLPHISAPTNQLSASKIVAANVAQFRATGVLPLVVDFERGY